MKKIILALMIVATSGIVVAQSSKVQTARNHMKYDALDKAKVAIDAAAVHPKTQNSPSMYEVKGKVYYSIAIDTTGRYDDISKDAIFISAEAYKNAEKFANGKTDKGSIQGALLFNVYNHLWTIGYAHVQKKEFSEASKCYGTAADIKSGYDILDTLGFLYAGNMAAAAKDYDQSIVYFDKIKGSGYQEGVVYSKLVMVYKNNGDTAQAMVVLDEGIELYPNNQDLLISKLNIYIAQGESDKALSIINKAIEGSPENSALWFTRGLLYRDKAKNTENSADVIAQNWALAESDYLQALKLDTANAGIYEELSSMYLTLSNVLVTEKNSLPFEEEDKYNALTKEINAIYAKTIPYLEKAYELNPDNEQAKENLLELYMRTKDMDKYNKLKAEGKTE